MTRKSCGGRLTKSAAPVVLLLLMFACGGDATTSDPSTTTVAASTTDTSAVSTTTFLETTTTTSAASTTSAAVISDCPAPATPASGWRFLQTENWKLYHPGDWEDVSWQGAQPTADIHFDSTTISEAGLEGSEPLVEYVLRDPVGGRVLLITHLEGVTSPLEEIYQRAEDRYSQTADFEEMIEAGVAECLGGEPAIRVDFTFGSYFQQSWFTLHNGALFHADFLAASPDDAAVAVEIMSTWDWITPLETEATGDAFTMAEMATEVDDSASGPDPSWFADEFSPQDSPIYAVFQLAEGTSGQIVATWSREGEELLVYEFFYAESYSWGYVGLQNGGVPFEPGAYQVAIELDDDVARVILDFTVTDG
ncbi:MAG: hypothetical protein LC739_12320 [Actinobacteria bacterium]|nr:hypothetical protein [Actinomycetota bacterium]